jgi:hypothetical protein
MKPVRARDVNARRCVAPSAAQCRAQRSAEPPGPRRDTAAAARRWLLTPRGLLPYRSRRDTIARHHRGWRKFAHDLSQRLTQPPCSVPPQRRTPSQITAENGTSRRTTNAWNKRSDPRTHAALAPADGSPLISQTEVRIAWRRPLRRQAQHSRASNSIQTCPRRPVRR